MKLEKAIFVSLIAHVVMIALLAFNFQFSKVEVNQSASSNAKKINAKSVNAKNVEQLVKKLKQKDIDKKNKELERLRKIKQQEEQTRKKRIAEEKKLEETKRKQVESERKRKQEEKKAADAKKKRIADDKARKKKIAEDKKKKLEQEKKAKAEAERKRKQKLAEEKKRKEEEARKKKEAEEKAAQEAMEREMDRQMAAEAAELAEASRQIVMSEVEKYRALIVSQIKRNWIEPETGGSCNFKMSLAPGGLVLNVQAVAGDNQHCETGLRAIYKAEPLPVSSDPDVFAELKNSFFQLENLNKNE